MFRYSRFVVSVFLVVTVFLWVACSSSNTNTNSNMNTNPNTNSDTNSNMNTNPNTNPNTNSDTNSNSIADDGFDGPADGTNSFDEKIDRMCGTYAHKLFLYCKGTKIRPDMLQAMALTDKDGFVRLCVLEPIFEDVGSIDSFEERINGANTCQALIQIFNFDSL